MPASMTSAREPANGREPDEPQAGVPQHQRTTNAVGPYAIEERIVRGETLWIAIRARGAEWSWLTPQEAVAIALAWLEKYGQAATDTVGTRVR